MSKGVIKFLTSTETVFLCPYCMRHISGIISKCPHCSHNIGKNIDVRTTEKYRERQRRQQNE